MNPALHRSSNMAGVWGQSPQLVDARTRGETKGVS